MTSLYGQYIKEKEGTEILEMEKGYITFRICENEVHVMDLFVTKSARGSGLGWKLCKDLESLAKERGCSYAKATVVLGTKGQTDALKFHLAYGMQLISADNSFIVLGKEI